MEEYIYQEYPKMLYIANEQIIVHNKLEEDKIKGVKNEPASEDNSQGINPQSTDSNRSVGRGRKPKQPRSE